MITLRNLMGLDDGHVIECQSGQRLHPEVCAAFSAMQQAAHDDGIDCQLASGYRSFSRQFTIWQRKWAGATTLLDIHEQPLEFDQLTAHDKLHAILTWSALPGTSRHHWGTDFDVYDRVSIQQCGASLQLLRSEYEAPDGPCHALNQWLDKHAKRFGFIRPYLAYCGGVAAEPWHLSYQALAEQYSMLFDINQLKNVLYEHNIPGLDTIGPELKHIYQRYVLNKGHNSAT